MFKKFINESKKSCGANLILFIIFSSVLFLASSILLPKNANANGIAVVNMQKIIATSNQGKKANSELEGLAKKYNAKMMAMRQKIGALETDLKQNGSIMSSAEKTKKTKEFETEITSYQAEGKHVQGILSEKKFELLKGILQKADSIVKTIAVQKGYSLVIDTQSVVYRKGALDLTNQVLSQMNK